MTQNTREYQLTTEWDMYITMRLSPYMLRTCCCRICGGFLRRTIQKELSKCNFSDVSILAPWQSSKLTASEFPNRTGGGGNPEVAKKWSKWNWDTFLFSSRKLSLDTKTHQITWTRCQKWHWKSGLGCPAQLARSIGPGVGNDGYLWCQSWSHNHFHHHSTILGHHGGLW